VERPAQVGEPLCVVGFEGEVVLDDAFGHVACATGARKEFVSTAVITTSTNWPISLASPAKFTCRMFSVLPVSSFGFFFEGPVTRMRCVLPTIASLIFAAWKLIISCRRDKRSCFTASGVGSNRLAAGVPGRFE